MIVIVALGLDSQRRLAAEATAHVASLIRVAAEQTAHIRDDAHQLLAAVAATEALLDHDPVECAHLLRGLQFEPHYANLGVADLEPQYLKLDVGLIRGVDRDPTRQAMVAGLTHFATRAGCEVIAEGIEKSGELKMLRELGVGLGQGYLLGRPELLPSEPSAQRPRT